MSSISEYLAGDALYGDDFSLEEIEQWFKDEEEGYANLGAGDKSNYSYQYHELNKRHAFRRLAGRVFPNALGLGSAYCDELEPIAGQISKITVLEPSSAFDSTKNVLQIPCEYIKPNSSGIMPFEDETFDLISCLGVLHHIPNVSFVLSECHRCLAKGGTMILREPIVSMGDWRNQRPGLTTHERGIPIGLFNNMISRAGLEVEHSAYCVFPIVPKLFGKLSKQPVYNNAFATKIDSILSSMFSWNQVYHRTKTLQKLAPASVFFVLRKK
ncbi:methyltransferase domain-containing protein [bacterium]|nr:methyltransferase domain-containing protein [bacterium]